MGITGFATLVPAGEPEDFAKADIIVVLAAGMSPNGVLHKSTILRVEKGVALFNAGASDRLFFTGGRIAGNGPGAGEQMTRFARDLGVPMGAIGYENTSLSTLQNALFSYPLLQNPNSIILVTEGFHLPRSWLSFKWAAWQIGQDTRIILAPSTRFRRDNGQVKMVLREGLAWAFNLSRVAVWHGADIFGIPRETRDAWLQ